MENLATIFSTETGYEDSCTWNRMKGTAYNGNYFTRAGGKNYYSAGVNYFIPVDMPPTMMRVYVDCYCRKGGENFGQKVVVSLQKGDSVMIWREFPLESSEIGDKEWVHIFDSAQFLYSNPSHKFMQVKAFAYDEYNKSYIEMDNLKMTIKEVFVGTKAPEQVNKNIVFKKFIDFEDSVVKPRIKGCAYNGKYYAHVDGKIVYGGGCAYAIPDSLNNTTLCARLNYFCRTDSMNPSLKMVVAVQNDDTLLYYKEFAIAKYKVNTKFWTNITDTAQFKYNSHGKKGMLFKVFAYNVSKDRYIDVDDINVVLERKIK